MPPRAQQRPPQSLTPQPGAPQNVSPVQQLQPQQLAALQEHIRNTRQQTGQEVTPAMITEWMHRNGINTQQSQQVQQPQQVQQQLPQQPQQGGQPQVTSEQILHHLYPPQLAGDPRAALAHLTNVLFPPNQQGQQSPFLQRVMQLAQNGRLSPEQMAQLKQAVAMKNANNPQAQQQQQQQQQQYQQQQHPQAQLQAVQMAQQQQLASQTVPPPGQPGQQPLPTEQTATQAVQQLRNRVHHIEALLQRPDVNDEQRAKMQTELDTARANLSRVVKMLLAAQQQQQANQAQAQVAAASGAAPGVALNPANLQEAQRIAMERKLQIQAQQVAAAQAAAQQQANGGFRTASPATGFPGQPGLPPQAGVRGSPAMGQAGLPLPQVPGVPGGMGGEEEAKKAALAQAQAMQAAAAQGKKLTKKQQADVHAMSQQQAAQQAQAQAQALAQAQAMAQAQAAAAQGGAAGKQGGTPAPGGAGASMQTQAIPGTLNISAPQAEGFPPPRPTISGGMANSPSISTPAITRPSLSGYPSGGVADAFGAPSTSAAKEVLPNKDMRADDSKGRTVSKRKIRELVEGVDPQERLSDEVEDLLLEICDEFIDSVTRFGCQLAKHRKSDRLEVKDLALHLERSYNIRIPGFATDETRQSGARRVNLPPGHAARLAAIREGGRRR
ncbi:hypothetical protein JCM10213_008527 [Rhodosporidiobolus nylandii]